MRGFLVAALLIGSLCPTLLAEALALPPSLSAIDSSKFRPISLAKLIIRIPRGDTFGIAKYGFCFRDNKLTWKGGTLDIKAEQFDDAFRERLKNAGISIAGDPSNLFGGSDNAAEYLVGGAIDHMDVRVCYPNGYPGVEDYELSRGTAKMDVEWQIYSQIERKVVATIRTTGTTDRLKNKGGGPFGIFIDAFSDAVDQLARNDAFLRSIATPSVGMKIARTAPAGIVPIQIRTPSSSPAPLTDVVGSTAIIFANGGSGSGFLISPDGYLLTNHHVVGDSQYVKVRWSDGIEALGEVVRSDKGRDIALVKSDAKGRRALTLRTDAVRIGEDVFAVGAPTGERFQNTVTKGIVSATRLFNGYNFIQSDVGVTHGNSGGPIVDSKGQVVGLTDLGFDNAPMVNLFIPIDEAITFLGLQMIPAK